jgi:hypothetical protein
MTAAPKAYDVHGKRILQLESGKFIAADDTLAADLLSHGLEGQAVSAVTPEAWTAERQRRDADTLGGQVEAFGRGAAEAAGDLVGVLGRPMARAALGAAGAITGQQVDAGALEGVLHRSIPGMVAGAASGGSSGERLSAANEYDSQTALLSEVNPGAYGAGELAGNVAAGLATGGVTTAAGKGAAAALGRAGLGRTAAAMLGTGAAMAGEGALYGAAATEGQAREAGQTEGATAEQLFQGIGLSALLGGGIGIGFGAAGSAFRKLMARTESVGVSELAEAGAKAANTEGEAAARAAFGEAAPKAVAEDSVARLQSKLTGAEYETLRDYGAHNQSLEAAEGRNLWKTRGKVVDQSVPKVVESIDSLDEALNSVTDAVRRVQLKKEGVELMLQGVPDHRALEYGMNQIAYTLQRSRVIRDLVPNRTWSKGVWDRIDAFTEYVQRHMDMKRPDAAGAYVAADMIKREAQAVEKTLATMVTRSTNGNTVEAARKALEAFEMELQEPLRLALENENIWGRAGKAQKEINLAWKPYLESNARFEKELMTTDGVKVWADGRSRWYADSGKVKSWVESIGTSAGQTRQELVRQRLTAAKQLLSKIEEYHPLSEDQRPVFDRAMKASATLEDELGRLDETVGIANRIEDVVQAERNSAPIFNSALGSAFASVGGAITGTVAAGPMGGVMGGLGFLTRPGSAMSAADQVRAIAERVGVKFTKKAESWVKSSTTTSGTRQVLQGAPKVADGAGARIQRVAVPTAVTVFQGRDKTLEDAYERRTKQIITAQQNPDGLIDALAGVSGGLPTIDPSLAGALVGKAQTAISFLASKAPAGTYSPTALMPDRKSVVPAMEMARFARVWAAVERPMTVLEDLQRGIATPDQVEALRVVHPETYQAVRSAVMDALIDVAHKGGRIPISTRQQLDLLLDLGGAGEPAFAPAVVDRIAALQAQQQQKQPPANNRKAPNFAASARLPQDSWGSGKA